jgi:hypothetical protein
MIWRSLLTNSVRNDEYNVVTPEMEYGAQFEGFNYYISHPQEFS